MKRLISETVHNHATIIIKIWSFHKYTQTKIQKYQCTKSTNMRNLFQLVIHILKKVPWSHRHFSYFQRYYKKFETRIKWIYNLRPKLCHAINLKLEFIQVLKRLLSDRLGMSTKKSLITSVFTWKMWVCVKKLKCENYLKVLIEWSLLEKNQKRI